MRPRCAYKVAPSKNTLGSTASRDYGSVCTAWHGPASGPGWADAIWQLHTLLVMLVAVITCSHAEGEGPVSQGVQGSVVWRSLAMIGHVLDSEVITCATVRACWFFYMSVIVCLPGLAIWQPMNKHIAAYWRLQLFHHLGFALQREG